MNIYWAKIIETSGARIYGLAAGMVSLFITARLLGPEGRGTLAAVTSWVALFALFSGLSLGQVAQYRIQIRRDEEWLPGLLGMLAASGTVLSAVALLGALLAYVTTGGDFFKGIPPTLLVIGFAMLPFLIGEEYGASLLTAVGLLRVYNIALVIGRTLAVVSVIVLVYFVGLGVRGALVAQVMGQALVAIILLEALRRKARGSLRLELPELVPLIKGAAKLHFNSIGVFFLGQATILMLNHFSSKAEIGWYQLSYQLMTMLLVIPQAASAVLFSKMAEIGPDRLWSDQKKFGLRLLALMLLLLLTAYFAAPIAITWFAGPLFEPCVRIFRLLLPVLFSMSLAVFMTNQWIGRGIFLPTTLLTFATALVNVSLNLYAIPRYGAEGAAWSMLISFVGVSLGVQLIFAVYCERQSRIAASGLPLGLDDRTSERECNG
uniref:Undecaprenyl-diphospho-oligosaccharide flippase n=1 Tax=Geobacter metallireducens TaxID=28232 RepID=A0A831U5H8_GEOME